MSQNVNMGDKVNAGTSVAGAITLSHQQNIFTSDALVSGTKVFTVTSALIDALTIPYCGAYANGADTGTYGCTVGKLTPTIETLNNQGEAAVITPGTLVFTITGTSASVAPTVFCNFL